MKRSYIHQILGSGLVAASLAFAPSTLTAQAQTSSSDTTTTESTTPSQDVNTAEDNDGFDWGWLGLLGLAGLAGLAGRKREEPVAYRDPADVTGRSGSVR